MLHFKKRVTKKGVAVGALLNLERVELSERWQLQKERAHSERTAQSEQKILRALRSKKLSLVTLSLPPSN